ncbi:hypothetical protein Slin15195_G079570 [Septoria linicola]|uniref:Uncharacterized protein n=1 Tax=Septoria linicola TaxID=215465 RepID=A0A9Q9AWU2_9PEZI|nr:hypothetical protein Slin14017_G040770 [Septoria linicola]USW54638.1 hypothetical protein Slin15195_G079570 [Septoria linicola]
MGSTLSLERARTHEKIMGSLISTRCSARNPRSHEFRATFDGWADFEIFINSLTYIFLPKGLDWLRQHKYKVCFTYREMDKLYDVTLVAIDVESGAVDAKIESSQGAADKVDAFKAWKEHVQCKLGDISVSVPEEVVESHVGKRQAPPPYKTFY